MALFTLNTLPAAVAFVAVLAYLLYRAALPKPIPGIPYHKSSAQSIWGDVPAIRAFSKTTGRSGSEWIIAQAKELDSPIFQIFILPFQSPRVFITDHREGYDIMQRRTKEFDRSTTFGAIFRGTMDHNHILLPTGDRWRAQRRLLSDTMTPGFLNTIAAKHLYRQSINLVNLWRTKASIADGRPFHVGHDSTRMAFDSIWAVAFGKDIDTVKSCDEYLQKDPQTIGMVSSDKDQPVKFPEPEMPLIYRSAMLLMDTFGKAREAYIPRLFMMRKQMTKEWKDARDYKNKLIQDSLDDAKNRLISKDHEDTTDCAADHMVFREQQVAEKENREPQYNSLAAKDELFGYLVAGHETTASTIQWAIKRMSANPACQIKLREHLHAAYPEDSKAGTVPSVDAITKTSVPYLDGFIEEALRLGLIIPGQSRVALQDAEVLGHRIPKGIDVMVLCNGPGFLEPDPFLGRISEKDRSKSSREAKQMVGEWDPEGMDQFKPERWLKEDGSFDPQAGPNRQFGAGERGCFGRRL